MVNQTNPAQQDFFHGTAEIDRRMAALKEWLQPHFDRSALSAERQASFYEHMRDQIPVTMEQESRGVSRVQLLNAQQKRLQQKPDLTVSNSVDPVKLENFMSAVKASMAKYQAEAVENQQGKL